MNRKLLFFIIIPITIISLAVGALYVRKWEYRKQAFEVNFFSLKRGRAIFIRSPDNKTMLVGGGQNTEVIRELTKTMPFYSRRIDSVFIPSATPAQVGGLLEIIDRYEIEQVFIAEPIATSTVLSQLMKKVGNKKIHATKLNRGDTFKIGDLHVEILFPIEDFKYNKSSLPELAMKISYNKSNLYLIGNLSKTIQKNIIKNIEFLDGESLIEFYNSATDSKVSSDLIEKIKPIFIFSTKEKSTRWISDGLSWIKGD
jgi:competence protein ComEC